MDFGIIKGVHFYAGVSISTNTNGSKIARGYCGTVGVQYTKPLHDRIHCIFFWSTQICHRVTSSSLKSIDLINLFSGKHEKNHFRREATAIGEFRRFVESKFIKSIDFREEEVTLWHI